MPLYPRSVPNDLLTESLGDARYQRPVSTVAAMRLLSPQNTDRFFLSSHSAPGDGGHGNFYVDPSDTTTADDGGTVFVAANGKRIKRVFDGKTFRVDWFGAKGDDATDDLVAINTCAAAMRATGGRVRVIFSGKIYRHSDTLDFSDIPRVEVVGEGKAEIKALAVNSYSLPHLDFQRSPDVTVRGLTINGNWSVLEAEDFGNRGILHSDGATQLTVDDCFFLNINDTAINDRTENYWSTTDNAVSDTKLGRTIITNSRFTNLNECLNTKNGGSRFIIIVGNHVWGTTGGFKIDGEGRSTWAPTVKTGGAVVAHNTFYRVGTTMQGQVAAFAGYDPACVAVQEWASDVIIEGNHFEGGYRVDYVQLSLAQTRKPVSNVRIIGNTMKTLANPEGTTHSTPLGDYIHISCFSMSGFAASSISGVEILDNYFGASDRSMLYIRVESTHADVFISDLRVEGNTFEDWSTLGGSNMPSPGCIYVYLSGPATNVLRNARFKHNNFIRNTVHTVPTEPSIFRFFNPPANSVIDPIIWEGNEVSGAIPTPSNLIFDLGGVPLVGQHNTYKNGISAQTVSAGTKIRPDNHVVEITSAANVTLTSNPTIAPAPDGYELTLHNTGTFRITFQDKNFLAGTGLILGVQTLVLNPGEAIKFTYSKARAAWVASPKTVGGFRSWNSAQIQDLTNNAFTTIVCQTEVWDNSGWYDNATGVYTTERAGTVLLGGGVAISPVVADKTVILAIFKNGTASNNRHSDLVRLHTSHTGTVGGAGSVEIDCLPGDTFILRVFHDFATTGVALPDTLAASNSTFFWGRYIGG